MTTNGRGRPSRFCDDSHGVRAMNAAAPIVVGRALLALMLAAAPIASERADAASLAHPDIATTLSPWRGRPAAPAIELKTLDGAAWSLAALRGKVVIVNFWATWCEPCRAEMPSLLRLREQFAGAPLEVVAINYLDDEKKIREFLRVMPGADHRARRRRRCCGRLSRPGLARLLCGR